MNLSKTPYGFESIDYRSAVLMKRMAKVNMELRPPSSEQDRKDNDNAVRMLLYVALLDTAMYDLRCELEDAGILRQNLKKQFNQAEKIVNSLHERSFKMLRGVDNRATEQYTYLSDNSMAIIDSNVMLSGLERAYSVANALCNLANKYYDLIKGRRYYPIMEEMAFVKKMLDSIPSEKYDLDFIIDSSIKIA